MAARLRLWAIVAAFAAIGLLFALAVWDRLDPPDLSRVAANSPEVAARDGTLLRAFLAPDGRWRLAVTPDRVSPRYLTLLKAYEDQRFDAHPGVDGLAAARALWQMLAEMRIVSGASTLTMQVARLLEPRPRGLIAKLHQARRAVQLELRYSKDEILALYLTLAPFGGNLEGVRAASLAYFGKEPAALDLAEAALLVALPQSPERLRPDRNPEAAREGRNRVLARLAERGAIAREDAAFAMAAPLPQGRDAMAFHAPHLAERLVRARASDAPERIVTTIDPVLQVKLERLIAREAAFLEDDAGLAAVIAEIETGAILAHVGSAGFWGPFGQIDMSRALRSPGSTLKPFIYALAFDDLAAHPETVMIDAPTSFGAWSPRNFDRDFQGAITARQALQMSLNVPAVMMLERVGAVRFAGALREAGATLAFPAGMGPSLPLALGGAGVTLEDLTMLFAALGREGRVRPLQPLADAPPSPARRLVGAQAAWAVLDVLRGAPMPDGWAMGQGLDRGRPIAFKTGTSYGFRDAWALGVSNRYAVGLWTGRPDGSTRPGAFGRNAAAPILLRAFEMLPGEPAAAPPPPAGTLVVSTTSALPRGLQTFARADAPVMAQAAERARPLAIRFPPDGATVEIGGDAPLPLKAEGGRWPLTWIVDGVALPRAERLATQLFAPSGAGVTRITVVDADGTAASATVRFTRGE